MSARDLSIEDTLARLHSEFPEVFISATAPVLVKPELRNGHKGTWPAVSVVKQRTQSAAILDYVAKHQPVAKHQLSEAMNVSPKVFNPLVVRKYLKKTPQGLVRTAKPYTVSK